MFEARRMKLLDLVHTQDKRAGHNAIMVIAVTCTGRYWEDRTKQMVLNFSEPR